MRFDGQWLARLNGENGGTFLLDLEVNGKIVVGTGYFFDKFNESLSVRFHHSPTQLQDGVKLQLEAFNKESGYIYSNADIQDRYPEIKFPLDAWIKLNPDGIKLIASWRTSFGTSGEAQLTNHRNFPEKAIHASEHVSEWSEFVSFVAKQPHGSFLYRGQHEAWPLATSFHRTLRTDLRRYRENDVNQLHRVLCASTRHYFNISIPEELGAFLNLAQHHGFPTPLLDWSESPYIAAFFAFHNKRSRKPARIFALDREELLKSQGRFYATLSHTQPHFSILEPLPLENQRALPQQALLALTNLKNVEAYLRALEITSSNKIIHAFDLPASEGKEIVRQLRMMGITQASMFPGLDGICAEMRARLFA